MPRSAAARESPLQIFTFASRPLFLIYPPKPVPPDFGVQRSTPQTDPRSPHFFVWGRIFHRWASRGAPKGARRGDCENRPRRRWSPARLECDGCSVGKEKFPDVSTHLPRSARGGAGGDPPPPGRPSRTTPRAPPAAAESPRAKPVGSDAGGHVIRRSDADACKSGGIRRRRSRAIRRRRAPHRGERHGTDPAPDAPTPTPRRRRRRLTVRRRRSQIRRPEKEEKKSRGGGGAKGRRERGRKGEKGEGGPRPRGVRRRRMQKWWDPTPTVRRRRRHGRVVIQGCRALEGSRGGGRDSPRRRPSTGTLTAAACRTPGDPTPKSRDVRRSDADGRSARHAHVAAPPGLPEAWRCGRCWSRDLEHPFELVAKPRGSDARVT